MAASVPACANHARRRSRATCAGCGLPLCAECRTNRQDRAWCARCMPAGDGTGDAVDERPREAPGTPAEPFSAASAPAEPAAMPPAEPDDRHATTAEPTASLPSAWPEPAPRHRDKGTRVGAAVLALLAVQAALAGAAVYAAWRSAAAAAALASRPVPVPPAVALRAPSLDLRSGTTLRGTPVRLQGEAPFGDFVAVLVDGQVAAVGLVTEASFAIPDVPLVPGEHQVSVVAHRHPGLSIESPRIFVRYEAPEPSGVASDTSAAPEGDPPVVASDEP